MTQIGILTRHSPKLHRLAKISEREMAAAIVPTVHLAALGHTRAGLRSSAVATRAGLRSSAVARKATGKGVIVALGDQDLGAYTRGGTGLLEKPPLDLSRNDPAPRVEEGGDMGRLRDSKRHGSGDSYRVLLVDDPRHTEKLVEKTLPEIVPSVSASEAVDLFHESRKNGVAIVIVAVKEHAEFYSHMMVRKGLRSAIEPDTSTV